MTTHPRHGTFRPDRLHHLGLFPLTSKPCKAYRLEIIVIERSGRPCSVPCCCWCGSTPAGCVELLAKRFAVLGLDCWRVAPATGWCMCGAVNEGHMLEAWATTSTRWSMCYWACLLILRRTVAPPAVARRGAGGSAGCAAPSCGGLAAFPGYHWCWPCLFLASMG
jgi:hypothetical protein